MPLPIAKFPDAVLRTKAEPVREFDDALASLLSEMAETMRHEKGVGLAAPQVGVSLRAAVIDEGVIETIEDPAPRSRVIYIINPEVLWRGRRLERDEEGCLSFPGLRVEVERPSAVKVRYLDENGVEHVRRMSGLLARCFLHEADHLDGITMLDRLEAHEKLRALRRYRPA